MSRSVLIIGGNRGIGHATVRAFVERGDTVAFTHHSDSSDPELAYLGALPVFCDITDPDQVESAFAEVEADQGPVEVLVVNAGVTRDPLLLRMSEEDFTSVLESKLIASYWLAKRAASRMVMAEQSGRIILVSSPVALQGEAGQTDYPLSTEALIGFGRSLAREVASRGITVNVVTPGLTDSAVTAALPEARFNETIGDIPLGCIGRPEEIAATIAVLADEEASDISGAVVPAEGGVVMGI